MEADTQNAARDAAQTPEQLLAKLGLDSFRPGQREAVQAALDGRDSLVVMPTGGGKSLCYQLPALADIGLVVVVSPLIALMADQQRRMSEAGVDAVMLASGQEEGANARALRGIADGTVQLVLAAPERFASSAFRDALAKRKIGLFVVDEAHCVAEWGHDFRPDYLRLHEAIESLSSTSGASGGPGSDSGASDDSGHTSGQSGSAGVRGTRKRPTVMAATATATPRVADEIAARLGLHDYESVRSGFDRPNLTFDVATVEGKGSLARKKAALMHVLKDKASRPAVVYCGTRKATDEVAAELSAAGIATVRYHAGMTPDERRASQSAFMEDKAEVVVATNAFGMGVDKSDVRTVIHWALPTSLESYYQEAGRAGRDGEPARALLLAARMDLGRLIRFIKEKEMGVDDVKSYVAELRRSAKRGATEGKLIKATKAEKETLTIGQGELGERQRILLSIAERSGAAELQPGDRGGLVVHLTGKGSPRAAHEAIQTAKNRSWDSYKSIEKYSSSGEICRRRQILDHFGDDEPGRPTGRCCDVCDPDEALEKAMSGRPPGRASSTSRGRSSGAGGGAGGNGTRRSGASGSQGGQTTLLDATGETDADPVDEQEFEKLRAWRYERAEGKPAYTIANNAVLEQILRVRPANEEELLQIQGVGPAFCEKHGESLLEAIIKL